MDPTQVETLISANEVLIVRLPRLMALGVFVALSLPSIVGITRGKRTFSLVPQLNINCIMQLLFDVAKFVSLGYEVLIKTNGAGDINMNPTPP